MIDRDKVIEGLKELCEYLFHEYKVCYHGDVEDTYNRFLIANNALELLKEQNGVPYVFDADGETACGVCGCHFDKAYSNCPKCGKKVDWNA